MQYRSLALVTGDGLLVSEGEDWLRGRRLVQPAFHQRTLEALGGHVAGAAQLLTDAWDALPDGTVVDVDQAMMRATLEVVGRALFSTDLGPQAELLVGAVLRALDRVVARARSPLPLPLVLADPGQPPAPARRSPARRQRRGHGAAAAGPRSATGGGPDLLGLLLESAATDEEPSATRSSR